MSTSAGRLLYKLERSRYVTLPGKPDRMNRSIEALNAIDSSFSDTAERILGMRDDTIEQVLVSWVDSDYRIDNAIVEARKISASSGLDYNAATFVLEDALLQSSVKRLHLAYAIPASRVGHKLMLSSTSFPQTTMLNDTPDDVDRYCHSLAVASLILNAYEDEVQQFIDEAPQFITWAAGQSDLATVVQAALRTGSVRPETVASFIGLQEESPLPLHNGLL